MWRAGTSVASRMVGPDLVVPAQFFLKPSVAERQPETRLMLAVLEDAVLTLLRHRGNAGMHSRRLVRDVMRWVDARRSDWPFSFENICTVLGLDPMRCAGGCTEPNSRVNFQSGRSCSATSTWGAVTQAGDIGCPHGARTVVKHQSAPRCSALGSRAKRYFRASFAR